MARSVRTPGSSRVSQIGGILEGVLAALAHAHSHGLVHRDLKPENLLVADDGRIKIADFGLAQVAARTIDRSDTTLVAGTPAYMAPEQAMGQSVGIWSDLYSVGCIAFEQFTGHVPFHRSLSPTETLMRQVNEPIPPVRSVNPEVDREVSGWIERLLIKDPAQRPHSPIDVWRAFDDILIEARGPRWRREASLPFASADGGGVALPSAGSLETDEGEFVTYEPEFEPPREPEPEPAADRDFHTGEMLPPREPCARCSEPSVISCCDPGASGGQTAERHSTRVRCVIPSRARDHAPHAAHRPLARTAASPGHRVRGCGVCGRDRRARGRGHEGSWSCERPRS